MVLGNNVVCHVEGIGSIRLRMQDGSVKVLREVRYIPEVKRNLVSLGLLDKGLLTFSSADGKMTIKSGNKVMMVVERRGSLYHLTASVLKLSDGECEPLA